jgi:putative glycosyltransferase (TIGR04372 family)
MSVSTFLQKQIIQIRKGGIVVVRRKIKQVLQLIPYLPFCILAIPAVIMIRLIRPWLLVRIGALFSSRIGHFAGNTELYLCEYDANINKPERRHVDFFYIAYKPICNLQLATMWRRVLRIWPSWFLAPIAWVNRLIPSGEVHKIGNNTQHDRDVHNLLFQVPPHLQFTFKEEAYGEAGLRKLGIPYGASFVCLAVRDSAYLALHLGSDFSYHDYRDTDIQNYVQAAEELADLGYFVIRMGVRVNQAMKSTNARVIDYATNGMRSDFMDIYLGAKCEFCITSGTGYDAIPFHLFRRPLVFVNMVPIGYLGTYFKNSIGIVKHYYNLKENKELTINEIFTVGIGFSLISSDYVFKGIHLIENTNEEIRDVVIEMAKRLNGSWQPHEGDEALQRRFWEIFPVNALDAKGIRLHGEILTRFGAQFLRNNPEMLY